MKIKSLLYIFSVLLIHCSPKEMSKLIVNDAAGFNGGFETIQNNYPVNWQIYDEQTTESGSFTISIDSTLFSEGKQSLKFDVKNCDSTGGWLSPGISKEWQVNPGEAYLISFNYINNNSYFQARIGGVTPKSGKLTNIIKSAENSPGWKTIEYSYTIPKEMNTLRFELNILSAGTFWVDDIKFEKLKP